MYKWAKVNNVCSCITKDPRENLGSYFMVIHYVVHVIS
nr:MAG TPA: hypothetical protein [Caudoviricetes sp.]